MGQRVNSIAYEKTAPINPTASGARDTGGAEMKTSQTLLNPNRKARLISWALAMLNWIALVLCDTAFAGRRRVRQRYRFISLVRLEKLLGALAVTRAAEMAGRLRRPSRSVRNAAPAGFGRRIKRPALMRATLGSCFRKALRAPTLRERIARLIAAFSDLDAFTRRYLLPRALKRLTKLCAIIMRAPPAQSIASIIAPLAPVSADTS